MKDARRHARQRELKSSEFTQVIKRALRGARIQDKELHVEGEHACELLIVSMSMSVSLYRSTV
jgi:hypothetical protein